MRYLLIHACLLLVLGRSEATSSRSGADLTAGLPHLRQQVESMRHEVRNHDSEIQMFDEKVKNLEVIIESLRDQLQESTKAQKMILKESCSQLESGVTSLEGTVKGIVDDIKQLKNHANETAKALASERHKITEIEKNSDFQQRTIEGLQTAVTSLLELLHVKNSLETVEKTENSSKTYRVKAGDSLEKIARAHQTSIKVLKELNNLSQDRIVIGQTLKLP